jgi:hypothetical protein
MGCGCGCGGKPGGCGDSTSSKKDTWPQYQGSNTFEQAKQVAASLNFWYSGRPGLDGIRCESTGGTGWVVVVRYTSKDALQGIPTSVKGIPVVFRCLNPIIYVLFNGGSL